MCKKKKEKIMGKKKKSKKKTKKKKSCQFSVIYITKRLIIEKEIHFIQQQFHKINSLQY